MKTKTIITALLLFLSFTSFAQHLVFSTIEELEEEVKVEDRYHINIYDKKLKIKREDGTREEYKIKSYEIETNQEDEDIYGEGKGVKFTEYYIRIEEPKADLYDLQGMPQYLRLMLPEKSYAKRFKNILIVNNFYRNTTFYYSVTYGD